MTKGFPTPELMERRLFLSELKLYVHFRVMTTFASFSSLLLAVVQGKLPQQRQFPLLNITHSLDLTASSQVYLIEPHWNPMIEEQALCRVHRVGQTRDITTIRYLVRDSFEEVSSHHLAS
jgi:DNA polymerase III psi subunit